MYVKQKTTEQQLFRIKQEKRREQSNILRKIETSVKAAKKDTFLLSKISKDREPFV